MVENPFCTARVQGADQLHPLGSLDLDAVDADLRELPATEV